MKKLIVGVVAVVFLVGSAAMAIDVRSQGLWQGNQNQSYDSYNFQGTSKTNTTTFAHTTDTSFTKYNQQNCNYDTHVFDIATTKAFTISNVQTDGNLQNQGLAMSQTGDQHSEATPAWGVAGGVIGGAGNVEIGPYEGEGWLVAGAVIGGVKNSAGASGSQGQNIGAGNLQLNGNLSLDVDQSKFNSFGFYKKEVDLAGFSASSDYDKNIWGVGGIVAGAAIGEVVLPYSGTIWGVGGIVGGFAAGQSGEFNVAANGYDIDKFAMGGYSAEKYNLDVDGHIDFQYQTGGGDAYQNSNTCAGITCGAVPTDGNAP